MNAVKQFEMKTLNILICFLSCTLAAQAQLAVTVTPPKVVGQKAIVQLAMTNNLADKVESARAICFLLDTEGKMVSESSRWVIGGTKERPSLKPNNGTIFNFVVSSPRQFATTNLTAKVTFSRLILKDGKLGDPNKDITIESQQPLANQNAPANNPNTSKALDAVIATASTSSPITIKHAARTPETIAVTNQMRPLKPQNH